MKDPVPSELAGWTFSSTSITGRQAVKNKPLTISFGPNGDRSGLNAGCNSMGGTPVFDGSTLTIPQVMSTMMACSEPGVMQQESWYGKWVGSTLTWKLEGTTLTLSGDGVSVVYQRSGKADQPSSGANGDDGTSSGPDDGSEASAVPPASAVEPAPGASLQPGPQENPSIPVQPTN